MLEARRGGGVGATRVGSGGDARVQRGEGGGGGGNRHDADKSVDVAMVISKAGTFLWSYHAIVDLISLADDAAMAEAYVVGMVVPQESRRTATTTTSRPSLATTMSTCRHCLTSRWLWWHRSRPHTARR
jgi:hypothetical protein